ncbi:MAG: hypothetical protein CMN58_03915 [Solibacterales bacterium]|nr:hypothetical protein [Bryobacterales bacterium]|tara:strand:+ start:12623 stop:13780 length:1158 start_codon:yes stop_codon:yes gene_type:complete
MFTFRKIVVVILLVLLATAASPGVSWADSPQVRFMETAGVSASLVSVDSSETVIQPRGGVLVIDLRATVRIRNDGTSPIRGISLGVWAGETTLGSKASVAVPGLHIKPGELFPLRLALRLLRPLPAPKENIVLVEVDGLLFDSFRFQGPDRLDSKRRLTVWTMQADRDRGAMREVLATGGPEKLREQVLARLVAQQQRPRLEARSLGRSVSTSVRNLAERRLTLAFSDIPESPVGALTGSAFVAGRTARAPEVTVENRSSKAVQYFELGWVIDDSLGRRYAAGSLPAPSSPIRLAPGQSIVTSADRRFSFWPVDEGASHNFLVKGIRGFITQVQFEDGSLWIPSRKDLRQANLLELLPASPEEQRLTNLYRRRGLDGLIEELGRY